MTVSKSPKKFSNLTLNILCYVNSKLWGPSTLTRYLLERPHLLPAKHRTKNYEGLFNLLKQHYYQLEKRGYIKKIGYGTYELQETAKHEGLKFLSQSDLSLESKIYIPHNKRLIFQIKSIGEGLGEKWKKQSMKGWDKYVFENEKVVAELVPANRIFEMPGARGLIVRLKDPKWYSIIKTEEDVNEVNALYDSEIIHETNELSAQTGIEMDTLNPKEVLQDGEIHDAFTEKLPDDMHFTDTVIKYNSTYGGEQGNKKMEFKTAGDVKDYVRESISREKLAKIREVMPEMADAIESLAKADQFLGDNLNTHIPLLRATEEAVKKLPEAVKQGVIEALKPPEKVSVWKRIKGFFGLKVI